MTKARDIAEFPKNLNIGEKTNLLTNGDFTTDTSNWTATTSTLSINSSRLQIIPDASVNGFATQQVDNLVVGRSYIASVDIIQDASTFGRLYIGTTLNGQETVSNVNLGVGSHSFTFTATATTHYFALVVGGGTGQTTIFDNARLTEANTITFPAISGTSPSIRQGTTVNDLAIATNNINRFNITNDGIVTKPSQPCFSLKLSSNINHSGTSPHAKVNQWVALGTYGTLGSHWSAANQRFTAPVGGKYLFNYSGLHNSGGNSAGYSRAYTYVNGAALIDGLGDNDTEGDYQRLAYSTILELSANDYVEIYINGGNSNGFLYANYTLWSCYLLG